MQQPEEIKIICRHKKDLRIADYIYCIKKRIKRVLFKGTERGYYLNAVVSITWRKIRDGEKFSRFKGDIAARSSNKFARDRR